MQRLTKILITLSVLPALLLAGCSLDDPTTPTDVNPPTLADAAARYGAVGNSLTAGFMDGGLMMAGQTNSYPRLIANQLGLDNTEFSQPWIAAPGIGTSTPSAAGMVAGVLHFDGAGISVLGETPQADVSTTLLLAAAQPTPYHNLGVPGAWLADGLNTYDAASSLATVPGRGGPNLFFEFVNRASLFGNETMTATLPDGMGGSYDLDYQSASTGREAIAVGGVLTTVWLGNNDVLGPAMSGDPTPGFGPASAAAFQADYTNLLSVVAGGLAQRNGLQPTIVVATIPNITTIPYFIPVDTFNTATGGFFSFDETDVAYVLFPALSESPAAPLGSEFTLTTAEATDVATAVGTFNAVINGVAAAVNASGIAKVGVFDAGAMLAALPAPAKTHFMFLVGTYGIETSAATTMFSLDGVHPNNVGYGLVANGFIDVINSLDGTSIPHVDTSALSWDPTYGVPLPTKAAPGAPLRLDPAAAAGMAALWR